jgi:hypothetical protein
MEIRGRSPLNSGVRPAMTKSNVFVISLVLALVSGSADAVRDYAVDLRSISMEGAGNLQIRLTSDGTVLTGITAKLPFGKFSVTADQLAHIAYPDLGSARAMVNRGGIEVNLDSPANSTKWGPYYVVYVKFYDSESYATEQDAPVLAIVFHSDQPTEMYVERNLPCPAGRADECKLDDRHSIPAAVFHRRQPNNSFKPKPLRGSA